MASTSCNFPVLSMIPFFVTSEIPIYQYLHGTQIGSQSQFTAGVNYRFLTKECEPEFEL